MYCDLASQAEARPINYILVQPKLNRFELTDRLSVGAWKTKPSRMSARTVRSVFSSVFKEPKLGAHTSEQGKPLFQHVGADAPTSQDWLLGASCKSSETKWSHQPAEQINFHLICGTRRVFTR